jgi:hypothetical protein
VLGKSHQKSRGCFALDNIALNISNVHFEIEKPGVSSLMAKQLARKVLAANKSLKPEDLNVDFGFFTAGKSRESESP